MEYKETNHEYKCYEGETLYECNFDEMKLFLIESWKDINLVYRYDLEKIDNIMQLSIGIVLQRKYGFYRMRCAVTKEQFEELIPLLEDRKKYLLSFWE